MYLPGIFHDRFQVGIVYHSVPIHVHAHVFVYARLAGRLVIEDIVPPFRFKVVFPDNGPLRPRVHVSIRHGFAGYEIRRLLVQLIDHAGLIYHLEGAVEVEGHRICRVRPFRLLHGDLPHIRGRGPCRLPQPGVGAVDHTVDVYVVLEFNIGVAQVHAVYGHRRVFYFAGITPLQGDIMLTFAETLEEYFVRLPLVHILLDIEVSGRGCFPERVVLVIMCKVKVDHDVELVARGRRGKFFRVQAEHVVSFLRNVKFVDQVVAIDTAVAVPGKGFIFRDLQISFCRIHFVTALSQQALPGALDLVIKFH